MIQLAATTVRRILRASALLLLVALASDARADLETSLECNQGSCDFVLHGGATSEYSLVLQPIDPADRSPRDAGCRSRTSRARAGRRQQSASTSRTKDAALATLHAFATEPNRSYLIEARVIARCDTGGCAAGASGAYIRRVLVIVDRRLRVRC